MVEMETRRRMRLPVAVAGEFENAGVELQDGRAVADADQRRIDLPPVAGRGWPRWRCRARWSPRRGWRSAAGSAAGARRRGAAARRWTAPCASPSRRRGRRSGRPGRAGSPSPAGPAVPHRRPRARGSGRATGCAACPAACRAAAAGRGCRRAAGRKMVPLPAYHRPAMARSSELLPLPLSPTIISPSPGSTVSDRFLTRMRS